MDEDDDLPGHSDRPITLPPEGSSGIAFTGIQFNSPLSGKSKNSYDLADSTYEVPKKRHSELAGADSDLSLDCPSYDEVVRSHSTLNESFSPLPHDFERNTGVTQSMMSSVGERGKILDNEKAPLSRRKSDTNLAESSPEVDIPCPSFPAPILSLSPVYGKINKKSLVISSDEEIEDNNERHTAVNAHIPPPPIRHRTKSKLRTAQKQDEELRACSHRATVDPNEYKREQRIYPRLEVNKLLPEKETSKCDSWSFYDTVAKEEILSPTKSPSTTRDDEGSRSTKTQSYENVEPRYGTVFSGTGEGDKCTTVKNILMEFDPLMGSSSGLLSDSGKSNHLLLLETLLSQETYGIIDRDEEELNQGMTSDDESLNVVLEDDQDEAVPTPPSRQDSLTNEGQTKSAASSKGSKEKESNKRPVMIIHQNSNLRGESMENILDERELERYLVRTTSSRDPENPQARIIEVPREEPSSSSAFYVDQNRPRSEGNAGVEAEAVPVSIKPKKLKIPAEPPPSYEEVLKEKAEQDETTKSTDNLSSAAAGTSQAQQSKRPSMMSKFSNVFNRTLIRKGSFKSSSASKSEVKTVMEMIPRPDPSSDPVDYEGHLVRYPTGVVEDLLKEIQMRHATIRNRTMLTFLNSEHKNAKETFPMEDVTTVQSIVNQKMTNGQTDIHCFEVTVAVPSKSHSASQPANQMVASNPNLVLTASNCGNSKSTRVCHVYGCVKQSERSVWMQKLLENMTEVFPKTATQDYKRAGWCYMKNSITANWSGAWMLLQRRKLLFYYAGKLDVLDLRKARCIVLKETDESIHNLRVEGGPILMIDCPPFTLYLIMNWPRETKVGIFGYLINPLLYNYIQPALPDLAKYSPRGGAQQRDVAEEPATDQG